jgi:2-polyprenyl-3-methyl-5-hydroxy-6-metoxy-1,4-benzoquinol methylase
MALQIMQRRTKMSFLESNDIKKTLQKPEIHQQWEDAYRNKECEIFYEQAFDYIASVLHAPNGATILDVGCGIGAHSIRLAKRGFNVLAVDFSDYVLKAAERNLQESGLTDKITLQNENILSLSFADRTFDYILCWGVLMHIPEIDKAISEIDRVLKKNGILVISEGNMFSIQSIFFRRLRFLQGRNKANERKTSAGLEYWRLTSSGKLLTRQANISWIKDNFKRRGFVIKKHISGQFTELFTISPFRLFTAFIHSVNHLWFRYIKIPHLAFGNIIILEKQM